MAQAMLTFYSMDEVVLQVSTRLENPTKFHMLQSQKRQVMEYLSSSPALDLLVSI